MNLNQKQVEDTLEFLEKNLRTGEFDIVNDWLINIDLNNLNSTSILAALTITFWGKTNLSNRIAFLDKAEVILKQRLGDVRAENLLKNRR